ncbi:MAG: extracellular solute-binding protein [Holophagales bacterium]|nr:extracellular solute-binding protein [Holophagales bacterium]
MPATTSRSLPRVGGTGRVFLAAVLLSPTAGFLAGCGGDGRTPLVLYSPHGRDLLGLFETTFEAQNPDIDVRWLDMGSQEVFDRVRSEKANPQADVWFGGPATILARGAAEDLLEPFRPSWADAVAPSGQHPEDLYFSLYRTPPILVFNEKAVSEADAPEDWEDLLDPRWENEVLIRDPLASGTMRTIFGMVLARSVAETGDAEAGFDWLLRLDAQTKEYVHNPALLHLKMERQEGLVTCWELTDILFQRQRGSPLGYRFPTSGSPVIEDSVGLVKGAPHPEAAKRFLEWVGGLEAQELAAEQLFRLPARTDILADELPAWAQEALAELVTAEVSWQLMEENGAEWMHRWDREVRGRGTAREPSG